ncbi:type II toxin-antitoxin system PemK/MazF family toxin [Lentilactobacillus sunkii]|uniref:Cell growth regulatory protein n=1 Tax=Lentilactobacillus sunkii DSM 19904 TaxID=1423808 RepID=A0A0R1KYQ2_9LACO|nr:type II toxin-antitoxin system PemK/MazF family toxin [Lentilactobacillus sunkii]KRK88667.1 cell growth regulatory protein [Lentilactobacillus sunkii DSM 19904]
MTEFEYAYHGYTPEQADLIWATFDPQAGREIQKRRPALVVSSTEYNKKTGFVQICPITSKIRNHPGFFDVHEKDGINGQVNAIQLRSIDFLSPCRNIEKIGELPLDTFGEVAQFITYIFNFDNIIESGE